MWWKRQTATIAAVATMMVWTMKPLQAADDIVAAFAVAATGIFQAYDGDPARMAKLFFDQTNEKGGLLGRKLRLVEFDTKSDRTESSKAGQEAVHAGAALVIVTCDYDFGAPAALQAEHAGVISVFLCAEDPKAGIQGVGKLSFTHLRQRSGRVQRWRSGLSTKEIGSLLTFCSMIQLSTISLCALDSTGNFLPSVGRLSEEIPSKMLMQS